MFRDYDSWKLATPPRFEDHPVSEPDPDDDPDEWEEEPEEEEPAR